MCRICLREYFLSVSLFFDSYRFSITSYNLWDEVNNSLIKTSQISLDNLPDDRTAKNETAETSQDEVRNRVENNTNCDNVIKHSSQTFDDESLKHEEVAIKEEIKEEENVTETRKKRGRPIKQPKQKPKQTKSKPKRRKRKATDLDTQGQDGNSDDTPTKRAKSQAIFEDQGENHIEESLSKYTKNSGASNTRKTKSKVDAKKDFHCFLCTHEEKFSSEKEHTQHYAEKHFRKLDSGYEINCPYCERRYHACSDKKYQTQIQNPKRILYVFLNHLVEKHYVTKPDFMPEYTCKHCDYTTPQKRYIYRNVFTHDTSCNYLTII